MTLWKSEAVAEELPEDRQSVNRPYRACERCGSRWGGYLIAYAGWLCAGCMYEVADESAQRLKQQAMKFREEAEEKSHG